MMPRGPRTPHTALAQSLADADFPSAAIVSAIRAAHPHISASLAMVCASQARVRAHEGVGQATYTVQLSERSRRYFSDRAAAMGSKGPALAAKILALIARDDLLAAVLDDEAAS